MNEKDRKLAHDIAWARAENNCTNGLEKRIVTALTTVRREARTAAFKEAAEIMGEFGRELRKIDFLARLEAADSVPSEGEGEQ